MPYGSSPEPNVNVVVRSVWSENGSETNYDRTYTGASPRNGSVYWSRTGGNTSALLSLLKYSDMLRDRRPLVWKLVRAPGAPRVPYKETNPRTGKTYWKRAPPKVWALRKGPWTKKAKKRYKGLDLLPNPLLFIYRRFITFGTGSQVRMYTSWPGNLWQQTFSGDLWGPLVVRGSLYTPGLNYSNAIRTNPSERFYQVASELDAELIPRLYDKVKNQDVNLLQALAEYRQSAGMFVESLTRLGRTLLKLKKLDFVGAAKTIFPKGPKDLASDWLLLQYGVKPLLSDVDGAAKMLAMPESRTFDIVVRRKRDVPMKVIASAGNNSSTPLTLRDTISSVGTVEVVYKIRVAIDPIRRDLSRLGFGNLNAVAWEVVPFSFVADWVIPVGDYLNNSDAFAGLRIISSHRTVTFKETTIFERVFGGTTAGYYTTDAKVGFWNTMVHVERKVGIKIPPLPTPEFKNPFSAGHLANAIALFTQLKRK